MSMRILWCINNLSGGGGVLTVALEMSAALAAAGHEVTLASTDMPETCVLPGVRTARLDVPPPQHVIWRVRALHRLPKLSAALRRLDIGRFDALVSQNAGMIVAAHSLRNPPRLVFMPGNSIALVRRLLIHQPGSERDSTIHGLRYFQLRLLESLAMRQADLIMVQSQTMRRMLQHVYPVRATSAAVVRHGVDLSKFTPRQNSRERREDWPWERTDSLRILYLGRLAPEKNVRLLIQAVGMLHGEVECAIVGAGVLQQPLEQTARSCGCRDRVRFAGWTSHPEKAIAGGDVGVIPSLCEPFGLVALEFMATGIPVIATRAVRYPHFNAAGEIVGRVAPWLLVDGFDPSDLAAVLEKLHADAGHSEELGRQFRRLVETEYTWARAAEEFMQAMVSV